AFAVAVSASSPRKRPTQMALTEPLSDCSTLPPMIGSANTNSVRPIGPWVRSRVLAVFGIAASCQSPRDDSARVDARGWGTMEVLEDPGWHVVRIATGLLLLGLLAGCASTYDAPVDAGSPFPPWCADIARRH